MVDDIFELLGFGGVIMMWVNLDRASDELPYSMSN